MAFIPKCVIFYGDVMIDQKLRIEISNFISNISSSTKVLFVIDGLKNFLNSHDGSNIYMDVEYYNG